MLLAPCPTCGARHELDAFIQHEYAREAVKGALELPHVLSVRIVRYLRLFVSDKAQALTPDRYATLLSELNAAMRAGSIEFKGRKWSVTLPMWEAAFDAVFEAVQSGRRKKPLRAHGYLWGVLCNMSNDNEAKTENQREMDRRAPVYLARQGDPGQGAKTNALPTNAALSADEHHADAPGASEARVSPFKGASDAFGKSPGSQAAALAALGKARAALGAKKGGLV